MIDETISFSSLVNVSLSKNIRESSTERSVSSPIFFPHTNTERNSFLSRCPPQLRQICSVTKFEIRLKNASFPISDSRYLSSRFGISHSYFARWVLPSSNFPTYGISKLPAVPYRILFFCCSPSSPYFIFMSISSCRQTTSRREE